MKTTLLFLASLSISTANAQTFEYLDINQVKARVNSGGDLHWDPTTGNSGYECPKGSGKNYGSAANIWLGGIDMGGQLKLAAQTYRQGGVDFWPGPLNVATASTNSATVNQYNRVWKLNKTDIDDFLTNLANGNVQNGSFTPAADLLSWPANGDISQNYAGILAPYVDVDGDAIYNPMAGDYPIIKGDQAIYTIFNDNYLAHQSSGGQAIGAEIHLMAYAYGPCSITSSNSFLNYTTFYNFKIINRSSFSLLNSYAGLFNDFDLGTYMDDYVGSDVADHYTYSYNSASSPSNEPAIGIVQLKGPIESSNSIDDDFDGTIDEPLEQMSMTNFMYFNNSFPGVPLSQTDPSNATEYYQYMTGFWKDGTPLTCGGNGYGGSTPTKYAYTSSTYTNGSCGIINWTESGPGSDKKSVMSSGPYTLQPGAVDELEYAYIVSFDSITSNPLAKLDIDVQSLHSIYNSTLNQCLTTSIKEQKNQTVFTLSPNPTNGILNINWNSKSNDCKIEVIDALGKVLISENHKEINQTSINVSDLSSGIYFVKITSGENTSTKKFIKE
jgi:hypothetical protein